jgi:hypothetical protein
MSDIFPTLNGSEGIGRTLYLIAKQRLTRMIGKTAQRFRWTVTFPGLLPLH